MVQAWGGLEVGEERRTVDLLLDSEDPPGTTSLSEAVRLASVGVIKCQTYGIGHTFSHQHK